MTRLLVSAVLIWFFVQVYTLLSSHASYSHLFSTNDLFSDASHRQVTTDFIMSLLVMLGYLLCHFRFNRASQTILPIAILMPVTGLLAQAYHIPDAYGQLSLLTSVAGVLCAMSLIAKQVSQTSLSYLLLLDDTGQHLRWIVAVLFLCAIALGGMGVLFGHDPHLTPLLITLALNAIVLVMTLNYYRKGVMHDQVLPPEELAFASELEAAIAHQEFYLVYQPQMDFLTGKLVGVEALIRWQHPTRGNIPPDVFIPLAEESGLIIEIGKWIFDEVLRDLSAIDLLRLRGTQISLNISPVQFSHPQHLLGFIKRLQRSNIPCERFCFEITEGLLLEPSKATQDTLKTVKHAGIKLSIDDFGTGYSALGYLKKYQIDYVKIDKSFIKNLEVDNYDFILCRSIIQMAHELNIKLIAEGVENARQENILKVMNCDFIQGFLHGKPVMFNSLLDQVHQQGAHDRIHQLLNSETKH